MLARFAMAVGILAAALLPQTANAERRVALVVGNSGYKHAAALRNPGNDASDMAETLKKLGFEVLLGRDLDQQDFAKTIEQFARMLDDADVATVLLCGTRPADRTRRTTWSRRMPGLKTNSCFPPRRSSSTPSSG